MSTIVNFMKITGLLSSEDTLLQEQGLSLLVSLADEELWHALSEDFQLSEENGWQFIESKMFKQTPGLYAAQCMNPTVNDQIKALDLFPILIGEWTNARELPFTA